jgi:O-antigen/teichoic acid export membrane protein
LNSIKTFPERHNRIPSGFVSATRGTIIRQAVNACLGLGIAILLARSLAPSERGSLAVLLASASAIASAGLLLTGGNEIIVGRDFGAAHGTMLTTLLAAVVTGAVALAAIQIQAIAGLLTPGEIAGEIFLPVTIFVILCEFGLQRILTARQDFHYVNCVYVASQVIHVILLVWAASVGGLSVAVALFANFGVILGRSLVFEIRIGQLVRRAGLKSSPRMIDLLREQLAIGWRAAAQSTIMTLFLQAGIWQVSTLAGLRAAGILRVAMNIMDAQLLVPRSVEQIVRAKAASEGVRWLRTWATMKLVFCSGALATAGLAVCGPGIVSWIFGSEYSGVYPVAVILLAGGSFVSGSLVLIAALSSAMRFPMSVIFSASIALACMLSLGWVLIPSWGAAGAAAAFLGGSAALLALILCAFLKHRPSSCPARVVFTRAEWASFRDETA